MSGFLDFTGQGWLQLAELTLAFVLSALVGIEREIRQKSAGLRTHTLVGVSAALIMLVSKYGFMDILANGRIVLDPSRVAAQVVSGIGFIGGGVILMLAFPMLVRRLPRSRRMAAEIQISYEDGRELLRAILIRCTELRFAINHRDNRGAESPEEALDMADYEGVEPGRRREKAQARSSCRSRRSGQSQTSFPL